MDAFAELGVQRTVLYRAAGIRNDARDDGRARLSWSCPQKVMAEAERQSGDPLISLRAGTVTRARGALAYRYAAAASVGEGLRAYASLSRSAADPLDFSLEVGPTRATLRIELGFIRDAARARTYEYLVGYFSTLLAEPLRATGRHAIVHLPHAPRGAAEEYERVLGAAVRFRQADCSISVPVSVVDGRMRGANRLVAQVIEEEIRRTDVSGVVKSTRARAASAVRELSRREGRASGRDVARSLGVSLRTLQRDLGREGTNLRHMRDGVLRAIAEDSLAQSEPSVAVIAVRLGFANAAAFGKAFRRWTGETPSSYRERLSRPLEHVRPGRNAPPVGRARGRAQVLDSSRR